MCSEKLLMNVMIFTYYVFVCRSIELVSCEYTRTRPHLDEESEVSHSYVTYTFHLLLTRNKVGAFQFCYKVLLYCAYYICVHTRTHSHTHTYTDGHIHTHTHRLAQLLEERPKAALPSDKESQNTSILSRDTLESSKTTSKTLNSNDNGLETNRNTTDTHSPPDGINTKSVDNLESDTAPGNTKIDHTNDNSEFNRGPEQIVPVTRKRPSCERETTRAESPLLHEEEMGTVLQEADSTTTVESDQDEASMEIDPVPSLTDSSKTSRDDASSSLVPDFDGSDIEASVAKRLKPSSPDESSVAIRENTFERREESGERVVSSLLQRSDSNGQVQNASTGQSETCLEDSSKNECAVY